MQDKFHEWKHEHFQLYDEDGNELNEDLEIEIDQTLHDFIEIHLMRSSNKILEMGVNICRQSRYA
ncbi:hypothetical protein ACJROX_10470 [Pseudalkalibacillus sp. A8]|uniref:hypothetical protein n=1 Tax=Pseudalkalibacillus sp. A8 TaxID=3382641 RepID=UPI0038B5BED4